MLDPLSAQANHMLAFALWLAEDYEESIEYDRRTLELAPEFVYAHLVQGSSLMETGRVDEAEKNFRAFLRLSPTASLIRAGLVDVYMRMGRRDDALEQLDLLVRSSMEPDHATRQSLVHAHAAVGNVDEALQLIHRGIEGRDSFVVTLGAYVFWDPLRSDPRFVAVLRDLSLPHS